MITSGAALSCLLRRNSSPRRGVTRLEVDTSTPYVIGKIVSRLEMDSRWALARSVRALVADRDMLRKKLDGNSAQETGLSQPTF
jgi:hypothetical protein